jgi:predicted transcriptional regulator
MTFSPREREVIAAIERCDAVGFNSLALVLEKTIPFDELETIVERLQRARLVDVTQSKRTYILTLTREGRRVARDLHDA